MATITYTVTVASGTNQYGTGNKFYINGSVSPDLNLIEGNTYIFDQSDSSNATGGGHILAFSTSPNNSPAASYTTGVTTTGTPGSSGANTTIESFVQECSSCFDGEITTEDALKSLAVVLAHKIIDESINFDEAKTFWAEAIAVAFKHKNFKKRTLH